MCGLLMMFINDFKNEADLYMVNFLQFDTDPNHIIIGIQVTKMNRCYAVA